MIRPEELKNVYAEKLADELEREIDRGIRQSHGVYPYEHAVIKGDYSPLVIEMTGKRYKDNGWEYVYYHTIEDSFVTEFILSTEKIEGDMVKGYNLIGDSDAPKPEKKQTERINWFYRIASSLNNCPGDEIWHSPYTSEIMCKTESIANAVADMIEHLYDAQGIGVVCVTGYYDPKEDERNGDVDVHTGWYYISIDG